MKRILVTGSSEGLGLMAGQLLAEQGHAVVLHARNAARAEDAKRGLPQAEAVLVGDVSSLAGMRTVAEQANARGRFDAVIHNVGVGFSDPGRIASADGLPVVFAVNVLAPYVLTALIARPQRLVYLSSGMHLGVRARFDDLLWERRNWEGMTAYSESKLYDAMLAFAMGRLWPDVLSNALEPGWVATRMGGPSATDDLDLGHRTQVWLAVSDDADARVSGRYFRYKQQRPPNADAENLALQDELLGRCEAASGVQLPRHS